MAFDRGTVVLSGTRLNVVEEHGGRVARIVFSSPTENTLDLDALEQLGNALDTLATWPNLSGLVLDGGRDFSTGFAPSFLRPPYVEMLLDRHASVLRKLAALEAVRIAQVRGRCFGAGLELALLCHVIVADGTAKFAFPEAALGSFAPAGVALLEERIGRTRAHEWLLSARVVLGDEALAAGLVTTYAGGWDNADTATERHLAQYVLSRPTQATRALARALSVKPYDTLVRLQPLLDKLYRERIAGSADHDEALSAALRGRPPRWQS